MTCKLPEMKRWIGDGPEYFSEDVHGTCQHNFFGTSLSAKVIDHSGILCGSEPENICLYGLRHLYNSATLAKKTSFAISKVQEGAISIYLVTRHPENPSIMSFNNRKFSMNKYTGVPRPSASNNGQPKARRFSTNEPSSQGPVHRQDLTTIDADILQNVTLPYTSNSETLTRDTKVSMLFPERQTYY